MVVEHARWTTTVDEDATQACVRAALLLESDLQMRCIDTLALIVDVLYSFDSIRSAFPIVLISRRGWETNGAFLTDATCCHVPTKRTQPSAGSVSPLLGM
jgi:hypothetical protein